MWYYPFSTGLILVLEQERLLPLTVFEDPRASLRLSFVYTSAFALSLDSYEVRVGGMTVEDGPKARECEAVCRSSQRNI